VLAGAECCAGAFRRAAWEQIGGFDETLAQYGLVVDLALRLRSAGWETDQAADAVGVHINSATLGFRSTRQRRLAGFGRAYLLRRYRVLHRPVAPRTLATEALVAAADALLCRDLERLRGLVDGWRAARTQPALRWPPPDAIDHSISLRRSLALRWRTLRL
jgi:GT2 family glycosyltransferase